MPPSSRRTTRTSDATASHDTAFSMLNAVVIHDDDGSLQLKANTQERRDASYDNNEEEECLGWPGYTPLHDIPGRMKWAGQRSEQGDNINIYNGPQPNVGSAPPAESNNPDQLTTASSPTRSAEIYHRNLITKRRGSPLWIPEPNNALHVAYQQKGVSFGDVGLLSPSGSFDFFFNICYPSDDPINSGGVPEGFKPFKPSPSVAFRRIQEFEAASYVASESIKISRKQCSDSQVANLVFESSATEGAILALPHGAQSEDVIGTRHLRQYVLENIESWYKLIMGNFGCDVENGDILVVTGCDKTDSWGVATFFKSSEAVKLTFQPIPSSRSYNWEYSGSFDARTGPNPRSIQGLHSSINDTDTMLSEPLLNQCVFVRTLTGTLRNDIWKSLQRAVCLNLGPDRDEDVHEGESFMRDDGHGTVSSSGVSTDNENLMQGGGSGLQRQHLPALDPSISLVSNVSTTMMNHPSKLLNQFLWNNSGYKYPFSRVVITEDKDWISVLRDSDSTLPDIEELYRRIADSREVETENPGDSFLTLSFDTCEDHVSTPELTATNSVESTSSVIDLPDLPGPLLSMVPIPPLIVENKSDAAFGIDEYVDMSTSPNSEDPFRLVLKHDTLGHALTSSAGPVEEDTSMVDSEHILYN
ncbi:hypothetical protein D9613_012074 [Agrocybe pediades]|uniref:Uncharacterized protein n=1 Tax=Agrocybe pediades TaxID=84607 RepID=A0A8H4QFN0_9AGAR|nr:hypothetical protein D9613_012074 [Agrocybe pediades]